MEVRETLDDNGNLDVFYLLIIHNSLVQNKIFRESFTFTKGNDHRAAIRKSLTRQKSEILALNHAGIQVSSHHQ